MADVGIDERTDGAASQADVIAFLRGAAAHPGVAHVDVVETHGNLVFLAGPLAWKIKRAVKFPYMDFSTLSLRHAACLHEIEVNARLSPELYLGVVAITRDAQGRLAIAGDGRPVEWAVKMCRFEQADLLSARAGAGLSAELAKAVADSVFASHGDALRVAGGGAERVAGVLDPLLQSLAGCAGLDAGVVAEVAAAATRRLPACAGILDRRAAAGLVRRCHGDLHCANIVLWQGRPLLYDAIEFDDEIATVDTLYDLAFLLMDLDHRHERRAANLVLNRYLWRSGEELDLEGLRSLPLFLAMRAMVRALVTAERAGQQQGKQADGARAAAGDFLALARAYLRPAPQRLVAIAGLSGTGKSTLAAALAPALGSAPGGLHLRSDLERKALFAAEETERLPASAYTPAAAQAVYDRLLHRADLALAAGASVIVDAVSAKPGERAAFGNLARAHGADFVGLWLTGPPDVLLARVGHRRGDASDADQTVVRSQLAWDIGPLGEGWRALDASGSMPETLQRAAEALGLRLPCEVA